MKKIKINKYTLFFLLILQNFIFFIITFLNFSSLRGTDFNKYSKYFYYFFNDEVSQIGFESGIGYYWFVTKFFNILKTPLLYSENNLEAITTASIQLANYVIFGIGLIGIHYFFKKSFNFKTENTLPLLILLSIFPPLIGAKMILKPEIFVFGFLPWLIFIYYEYFEHKKIIYLIISIPMIALLLSLKASISLMIILIILITFNKRILDRNFIILNFISLAFFSFLIYENYMVNGKFLWEHTVPENYNDVAELTYIYNLSINELWFNPYRENLKNSMLSILFADTFGDYWQRYWFHYDGWGEKINGNSLSKNFPGNLNIIRISIIYSIVFYVTSIYYLTKEKNNKLFSLGISGFVGIAVLLINSLNLFPFLTKNFDAAKGDPMKTHLFSFLLAMTFLYFLIKLNLHKDIWKFIFIFLLLNIFFLVMSNALDIFSYSNLDFIKNRLFTLIPCNFNSFFDFFTITSNPLCSSREVIESTNKYFNYIDDGIIANKLSIIFSFFGIIYLIKKEK